MKNKKIYTLGPLGSFHHLSASSYLGKDTELAFCESFEAIFEAVKNGHLGWIAIHNSATGLIEQHEQRINREFNMLDEYEFKLQFAIAAHKNIALEDIKAVYSHPQALQQHKSYLNGSLKNADRIEMSSTSAAAKFVADSVDDQYGVLCHPDTAKNYGLEIVTELNQKSANYTTFTLFS